MAMTSIYNGQFNGNILVAGRTGCGKTTFLEKLAVNKFFDNIIKTEWINGIEIDNVREAEIQSCFDNETDVHVATEVDELDSLIDKFKLRAQNDKANNIVVNSGNSFGENKKLNRLIILDDVSGVADLSKKFANFLTVSRKFGYSCIYVFHLIIPSNQIWQKIISQTNIFNIFPASVPINSISKILQANCILQTKSYVPIRSLWLNRVFTDLANSHEKHCLTIDCGHINHNGPGRYRSQADNPEKQVCYFNKPNDDKFYNFFISQCIKGEDFDNGIYFKTEKLRGKDATENFDAKKALENGTGGIRHGELSAHSNDQIGAGTKRSADSNEHLFRRDRKSARPRFLYER